MRPSRKNAGFTIVEVVLAMFILLIGMTTIIGLLSFGALVILRPGFVDISWAAIAALISAFFYGAAGNTSKALARTDVATSKSWHDALNKALMSQQQPAGSWAAVDAWSAAHATVHATALCALALAATS